MNRILFLCLLSGLIFLLSRCQDQKPEQSSSGQAEAAQAEQDQAASGQVEAVEAEAGQDESGQAEASQPENEALPDNLNFILSGHSTYMSFFGASGGGKWFRVYDITEKFNEPVSFKFYTVEGLVESRSIGKEDLAFDEYCECPEVSLEEPEYEDYYIGISGDWNPVPEYIEWVPAETEYAAKLGLAYLTEHGLEDPLLSIDQVMEVDIDQDGKTDALIDLFNESTAQTLGSAAGSYSVLLMVRDVHGNREVIPVASDIYTHDGENEMDQVSNHSIIIVADYDGDGVFELVIEDSYYEGGGTVIMTLKNGKFEGALRCFCGT